jgi:drug/metabolite transporter (DMT)-like permease
VVLGCFDWAAHLAARLDRTRRLAFRRDGLPIVTSRGWLLFAAMVLVWGIPYLLIKVAVEAGLSPPFVAWGRVALAAVLLLPVAWLRGALRGLGAHWRPLLVFSVVEIVVPFPLLAAGEQRVSSSLAAILIATVPLLVALYGLHFDRGERLGPGRLAGLLIGLSGVVALLGIDVAGRPDELVGAAMVFVTAIGYAFGPLIVKHRLAHVNPLGPVAAALTISALLLTPPALLSAPRDLPPPDAIGAVVVLGVVCSAIAFLLFFALIAEAGPVRASVITYAHPVVALVLGVLLLGERITPATLAGLSLILAGSWLATRPPAVEEVAAGGPPSAA